MFRLTPLLALVAPFVAAAVPTTVAHQGRLVGPSGAPLLGTHELDLALYDNASAGAVHWTGEATVQFDDGYFSVVLPGLDSSDLAGDRWLSISIDGVELRPRQPVVSVPFAVRAGDVDRVVLGDVNETCNTTTTSLHGALRFRGGKFEGCTSAGWQPIAYGTFSATGGTVTDLSGFRTHTFTSGGALVVGPSAGTVEVLVVAGGGGGGGRSGGGGGGGGVRYDPAFPVNAGTTITVTVGDGGAGGTGSCGVVGSNGVNSAFGTLTATGGGGGGSDNSGPGSGGSGGGTQYANGPAGTGISGQGFAGAVGINNTWHSGGGGGAGAAAPAVSTSNPGHGGAGRAYDISGTSTHYGGGGGGGHHNPCNGTAQGGVGGGGKAGTCGSVSNGTAGTTNTGGGGGGGATTSGCGGNGGNGGSGIVIVRYPN